MRVMVVAMLVATAGAAAVACGDPAGNPAFEFTPIPYTVIAGPGGTPIAVAEYQGSVIDAGNLIASVAPDRASAVRERLKELGFRMTTDAQVPDGPATMVVEVPTGAVPDALDVIRGIDGVESAEPNYARALEGG